MSIIFLITLSKSSITSVITNYNTRKAALLGRLSDLFTLLVPHAVDLVSLAAVKVNALAAFAVSFASSFRAGAVCFVAISHVNVYLQC